MRLDKTLTSLLIAGATALSCGATEENHGAGSVESVDDLLREVAASLCRDDCNAAVAAEVEYTYGRDCLEIFTLVHDSVAATFQPSLDAGRTSFDAAAAQHPPCF